ncbi:MAG: hypothetical protein WCR67_04190 [Bacilli bacterium]
MKRFKSFIASIVIAFCSIAMICGTGYGIWYFNTNSEGTDLKIDPATPGQQDQDDPLAVDDIAENYYFAAQTVSNQYYNVYFFPSPEAANYKDSSYTPEGSTTTTTTSTGFTEANSPVIKYKDNNLTYNLTYGRVPENVFYYYDWWYDRWNNVNDRPSCYCYYPSPIKNKSTLYCFGLSGEYYFYNSSNFLTHDTFSPLNVYTFIYSNNKSRWQYSSSSPTPEISINYKDN